MGAGTRAVAAVLLAAACAPPPAPSAGWESAQVIDHDARFIQERVSYRSDGHRIFGWLCRPNAEGRFPIVVANHGGYRGLGPFHDGFCEAAAVRGYVVIASEYRGEGGSEGAVEICLGETRDVLAMLELARGQPFVDPDRAGMIGWSHGGCITMQALAQGAPVQAAVNLFGPMDWAAAYRHAEVSLADASAAQVGTFEEMLGLAEQQLGGSPEEAPEAYAMRSPMTVREALWAWPGALMTLHGAEDWLVPPSQSCDLWEGAPEVQAFHVGAAGELTGAAIDGCSAAWSGSGLPGAYEGDRYLMVFDGVGHDAAGGLADRMAAQAYAFLEAKLAVTVSRER